MGFPKLRHFRREEFRHPDNVEKEFLEFLDDVREAAGIPFLITSDGRDEETNKKVGGSPYSLHLFVEGRDATAVDFTTLSSRARDKRQYKLDLFKILDAIFFEILYLDRELQLELVQGPTDWHIHLGLYPEGDTRESRVVLALD